MGQLLLCDLNILWSVNCVAKIVPVYTFSLRTWFNVSLIMFDRASFGRLAAVYLRVNSTFILDVIHIFFPVLTT